MGENPVRDSAVAPDAKAPQLTYAYTLDEILAFLGVLPEPAATIFATAAFAGLRRGEIRGLRWEDPCASEIRVVQARQYVCALSAALRFPLTRCALAATIKLQSDALWRSNTPQ